MQVLVKLVINKNLFNKVMPFCLRFVNKHDVGFWLWTGWTANKSNRTETL